MNSATPRHLLIRASAGSGKTYQLVLRFIRRLEAGTPPDRILATTFTRKAAGEILDRVLTWLAEASIKSEKCQELAEQLGDPDLTPQRLTAILARVITHLHRLQIRTLDSFFSRLASSLCHDLGLPAGWRILEESEDAQLRSEALQTVFAADWKQATELTRRLFHGETVKSMAGKILALIAELYPLYLETDAAAWQLPAPPLPSDDVIQQRVDALAALDLPATQQGEPNATWKKCLEKSLNDAHDRDWESFIANGIAVKILEGNETFARQPIGADVRLVYEALIEIARCHILRKLSESTWAARQLLGHFDHEYRRRKLARKAMRFEDIPCALGRADLDGRLEDADFRLDAGIDDLLLDEFQDTAGVQWRVLEPFARRIVQARSPQRTFFCVGDGKQAIYGWRGGVADLLDQLSSRLEGLESQPLAVNRRSSPPVIEAVNQVFLAIGDNAALARKHKHQESARRWAAGFQKHTAHKTELPGYVRLATARAAGENEKSSDVVLRYAAREIQRLAEEAPGYGVGVLTRTNYAVGRMAHELKGLGLDASEEGGVPLTDSPAVTALLSALKLADHPGDRASWFHVAQSPLGPKLGIRWEEDAGEVEKTALLMRRCLLDDGLGATLEHWASLVRDDCSCRDWSRLQRLVEFGYRFEPRATLRPTDFIEDMVNRRVADPSTARIRVMTIHQAKGLEFDIVVLPELERRLVGSPPELVFDRPEAAGPIRSVCRYANRSQRLVLPDDWLAMFRQDEDRRLREGLCLLYVALTRAIHALHMIVAPPRENERSVPATFAGVLRAALATPVVPASAGSSRRKAERQTPAAETTLFETGDPRWFTHMPPRHAPPSGRPAGCRPDRVVLDYDCGQRSRRLLRQSPSSMQGGAAVRLADCLRLETSTALDIGSLFHAWFELIEWLDDGEPTDDQLIKAAENRGLGHLDVKVLMGRFRECLRRPAIRASLLRPADGTDFEVRREWPIAAIDNNAVVRGNIDRLVLYRARGKVVRAVILDYKTDMVAAASAELAERIRYYRPQMEAYRRLTARQYGLAPEAVAARLLFIHPAVVLEV